MKRQLLQITLKIRADLVCRRVRRLVRRSSDVGGSLGEDGLLFAMNADACQ